LTPSHFELLLFSIDADEAARHAAAGIDGIVVDCEQRGKERRQQGVDTEVNHATVDDLREVRRATSAKVICRLNGLHPGTREELEHAIAAGADEVLLPMVEHEHEVVDLLEMADGRCDVGILIETLGAVRRAPALAVLPLSRVYVGLQDLAIQTGSRNIFMPLSDGTIERLRREFAIPFGVGGLTIPGRGHPIPTRLLASEMSRLRCDFTFLRRSFKRDTARMSPAPAIEMIRSMFRELDVRTPAEVHVDHSALVESVAEWDGTPTALEHGAPR